MSLIDPVHYFLIQNRLKMIQKLFVLTLISALAFGCGASKKAVDNSKPMETAKTETMETSKAVESMVNTAAVAGEWSYTIKELPDGDAAGTFTITKTEDGYSGKIVTPEGETDLKNVAIENDVLKCTFYAMGYTVGMSGSFKGKAFTGKVSAEGYDFPMAAVKKE